MKPTVLGNWGCFHIMQIVSYRARARLLPPSPPAGYHIRNVVPCLNTLAHLNSSEFSSELPTHTQRRNHLRHQLDYICLCSLQLSVSLHCSEHIHRRWSPHYYHVFLLWKCHKKHLAGFDIYSLQPCLIWFKRDGRLLYTAAHFLVWAWLLLHLLRTKAWYTWTRPHLQAGLGKVSEHGTVVLTLMKNTPVRAQAPTGNMRFISSDHRQLWRTKSWTNKSYYSKCRW